jgi:hypothetical protein
MEDNKLVFNTFSPIWRIMSYLTIDLSNIEGSSDNVYFISEEKNF